jgi:hypothetical protein
MNKTGQAMSQTLETQAHRLEAQVYQALANPTTILVNAHRLGPAATYRMSDQRVVQAIELLRLASAQPTRLVSRVAARECENIPCANK